MSRWLVLAAFVCTAAMASADELAPAAARLDVAAGVHVGVLFPFGIDGVATYQPPAGRPWDLDVSWQPSAGWQSYSVGAGTRPFHGMMFGGVRARYLQLHPPWSRGFDGSHDHQLGLGVELGARVRLGGDGQLVATAALGAFAVPSGDTRLPVLYTLTLGIAHRAWRR